MAAYIWLERFYRLRTAAALAGAALYATHVHALTTLQVAVLTVAGNQPRRKESSQPWQEES